MIDVTEINNVTILRIVQNAAGQSVSIAATSGLTVGTASDTSTIIDSNGGAIALDAGTKDLMLYAPIVSGGGAITLQADNDITLGTAAQVNGEAGSTASITVTADSGSLTMVDGSVIDAVGGDITVTAAGDVSFAQMITTGDVSISSSAGSVTDVGDTGGADVQAAVLTINAGGSVGTTANPLETAVDQLGATSGSTVDVDNTGDLTLTTTTAQGNVDDQRRQFNDD